MNPHPALFSAPRFDQPKQGAPGLAQRLLASPVCRATALLCVALVTAPVMAGGNLLVNGSAEAGPALNTGETVAAVPGWTLAGNFTVVTYNPTFGGPDITSPGPLDRGLNYFAGGPNNEVSSASQLIDLSSYQGWFANHALAFTLSGWMGGFEDQSDHAVLSVRFLDSQGNELEFATTPIIDAVARNNITGLLFVSSGFAEASNIHLSPAQALLTLTMTRTDGTYNDGYADNLSFTIDDVGPPAVPEPGTVALWLAGLAMIAMGPARRQRQTRLSSAL